MHDAARCFRKDPKRREVGRSAATLAAMLTRVFRAYVQIVCRAYENEGRSDENGSQCASRHTSCYWNLSCVVYASVSRRFEIGGAKGVPRKRRIPRRVNRNVVSRAGAVRVLIIREILSRARETRT